MACSLAVSSRAGVPPVELLRVVPLLPADLALVQAWSPRSAQQGQEQGQRPALALVRSPAQRALAALEQQSRRVAASVLFVAWVLAQPVGWASVLPLALLAVRAEVSL